MSPAPPPSELTLGVLAGGRATRLGGIDKAWLQRDGQPQVLRWIERFRAAAGQVRVGANHGHARYALHGIESVADRVAGRGPLGGLDALAHACATPWLLTLPVDTLELPQELLPRLYEAAGARGACACDDDGLQPLVALWCTSLLREFVADALQRDARAAHALVERAGLAVVRFAGLRFGNLNTPADLDRAGIAVPGHD